MHPEGAALIQHYFPEFDPKAIQQFEQLAPLYEYWNAKINVVSRKDLDELYLRHVLHSLAIAKAISFEPGTRIFDLGSGGGFPGIPLAIAFPDSAFILCDSIAKKTLVASEIVTTLGLKNVELYTGRSENVKGQYDFVVSRAVAVFPQIRNMTRHLLKNQKNISGKNAWICLKGGDINNEILGLKQVQVMQIQRWFNEPFFESKKVIYIPFQ